MISGFLAVLIKIAHKHNSIDYENCLIKKLSEVEIDKGKSGRSAYLRSEVIALTLMILRDFIKPW